MARLARAVFPGLPHHVTQRGNGRQQTFFSDNDYAFYRDLLAEHCAAAGVEVWSWVLMPNHVHLILVPADEDGLRRALAPVHRRYAGAVHSRDYGDSARIAADISTMTTATGRPMQPQPGLIAGPCPHVTGFSASRLPAEISSGAKPAGRLRLPAARCRAHRLGSGPPPAAS